MDASSEKPNAAWQPLTPSGVAAFANASFLRLMLVQLIFALLGMVSILWFVQQACLPVFLQGINRLPAKSTIGNQILDWRGETPVVIAENSFIAWTIDLNHSGAVRTPAHVQVEFGRKDLKVASLFGYVTIKYPRTYRVAFSREELAPWWGAWGPLVIASIASSVLVSLLAIWFALATLMFVPTWLLGLYASRDLHLPGSWRLCTAALLPGGLFLTVAILFYGFRILDLVQLVAAAGLHLLIPWGYAVVGVMMLPRHPSDEPVSRNPFARSDKSVQTNKEKL